MPPCSTDWSRFSWKGRQNRWIWCRGIFRDSIRIGFQQPYNRIRHKFWPHWYLWTAVWHWIIECWWHVEYIVKSYAVTHAGIPYCRTSPTDVFMMHSTAVTVSGKCLPPNCTGSSNHHFRACPLRLFLEPSLLANWIYVAMVMLSGNISLPIRRQYYGVTIQSSGALKRNGLRWSVVTLLLK